MFEACLPSSEEVNGGFSDAVEMGADVVMAEVMQPGLLVRGSLCVPGNSKRTSIIKR